MITFLIGFVIGFIVCAALVWAYVALSYADLL